MTSNYTPSGLGPTNRLGQMMSLLAANRADGSLLGAVCRTAASAIGAEGAGLSMYTDGHVGPICAHGDSAVTGEELQFTLGEGPSGDAFRAEELIEVTDLTSDQGARWPIFSLSMSNAGVRSLASFPLRIGAARFGALTVYRSIYGELSSEQVADGYLIAQMAAHFIVAGQAQIGDDLVIPEIETGFARMDRLHQATGAVMAQLDIGAGDALARIRGAAYAADRSLLEVASDILTGILVLPRDG